jgi:P pilus assembly chaperone PapD
MRKIWLAAWAIVAAAVLTTAAAAYEVGPLRIFLVPSQGHGSATISVNNNGPEELLFEVKTFRRDVARDGEQTLVPADGVFTIFPLQARVASQKTQAVRIQYRGEPVTGDSRSYVVQIAEVPVMKPDFSGVKFAYDFGVAVYVDGAKARVDLAPLMNMSASHGRLHFSVENRGSAYAFTAGYALRYTTEDGTNHVIEPAELAKLIEHPIIPPHSVRDFDLQVAGLSDGSVRSAELIDRNR